MTEAEAIHEFNVMIGNRMRTAQGISEKQLELFNMAIEALEAKSKITEIVNRQLIAGKNNYKEIYDCFYEIVKVVQDNY